MSRDGSGGYSIAASSWNPATNGNSATASDWNALLSDMVTAIEGSVAADGQTPMTGNLQMGNNKATGLAAATANGDSLRLENLIAGADIASAATVTIPLEGNYFKITGTTGISGFASTRSGRTVWVKFAGVLTLTNSSSFSMIGSVDVTTAAGDIAAFLFDGTNWICVLYRAVNAPYTIRYLAVAGGGGGSVAGGGNGGVLENIAVVTSGTAYPITIGIGGTGSTTSPTNGTNTVASGIATAVGGGAGAKVSGSGSAGGGGGGGGPGGSGGTGITGQGFKGGSGNTNGWGGGGGAGAQGQDAPVNGAGYGGAGITSNISGSTVYYGGGGGSTGNGSPYYSDGGVGGGGNGGSTAGGRAATAGAANSGGGGGGHDATPANGGSGIFIIAYPGTPRATGGTITQVGGNTIHTFTSNGTFVA